MDGTYSPGKRGPWFTERLNLRTTLLHINSPRLRPTTNRTVSLWNIFIILQLTICCSARDLDRYGIRSNSKYAVDDASGLLGRVPDGITPKGMHLYAVVGHHFNRSLFEEIKAFDRNLISPGSKLRVNFPPRKLSRSEWMVYNDDGSLEGVPLPHHRGIHKLHLIIFNAESASEARVTIPCKVEVLSEGSAFEMETDYRQQREFYTNSDSSVRCPQNEPVTIASVVLQTNSADLSHMERLKCVRAIEKYFAVPSSDVIYHAATDRRSQQLPILSGPGNVAKSGAPLSSVTLSWPLGCSSEMIGDIPVLDDLETYAVDGSLARATGYDVTEWYITNSVQSEEVLRRKRRATETDETSQDNAPNSRSDQIKTSPQPEIPAIAAPSDSPATNGRDPAEASGRYARPSRTQDMPEEQLGNDAPMLLFGMENVNAALDTFMGFAIPNDVFYDREDGMTDNMTVELHDEVTLQKVQDDDSWLQYDPKSHVMYGVPDRNATANRPLLLIARDSGDKTASFSFTLTVDLVPRTDKLSHKFTYVLSEAPAFDSDNKLLASFGRKLANATGKSSKTPGKIVMTKTGFNKAGLRFVEWYDSSLNDGQICKAPQIRDAAVLMIGEEAAVGRNKPKKDFAKSFRPEYRLKSITIRFYGLCATFLTTTTVTVTTQSTATEAKSTLPPNDDTTIQIEISSTGAPTQSSTTTGLSTDLSTSPIVITTQLLPEILIKTGAPTEYQIPPKSLSEIDGYSSESKITLTNPAPWVAFDSDARSLYLLPTTGEVQELRAYNSTHRVWEGKLSVGNKDGVRIALLTSRVLVEGEVGGVRKPNHEFSVTLKNYNLKTFTSADRMRFVRLIGEIFHDTMPVHIYLQPLREGSVVVTWYNTTLGLVQPCPDKGIAKLGSVVFLDEMKIKQSVVNSFEDANFALLHFTLERTDKCPKAAPARTPHHPPPPPPTRPPAPSTKKTPDLEAAGAQGKTTTIVIIAVIILCLIVIIVLLVIKCRKGSSSKNKGEVKGSKSEESSPFAANTDQQDTSRIKKGVPIIFQDEIGTENNASTGNTVSTPLVPKRTSGTSNPNNLDGSNVNEYTPLPNPPPHHPMTPPTPLMSNRPPPPYTKTR